MPVYFLQDAGVGRAVFRANDEAPDEFLCSVEMTAYNSDAQVRDRFAELVNAVADHFRRAHVALAPASRLAGLPCETCTAPEADDIRHRAGQISDASELALSPGGFPIGCCKRRILGIMSGRPDAPRPAAR